MYRVLLPFVLYLSTLHSSFALNCYTCSMGTSNKDTTCINDPANAEGQATTNCNQVYCTIFRQELLDPAGQIVSFARNCENQPEHLNEVMEDSTYRYYYKACRTDLCNGGNAIDEDPKEKGYLGNKSTILCPGIGKSNAYINKISITSILLIITFNVLI